MAKYVTQARTMFELVKPDKGNSKRAKPPSTKPKKKSEDRGSSIIIIADGPRKKTKGLRAPPSDERSVAHKLFDFYGSTLLACASIEEVRAWLTDGYQRFLEKALKGSDRLRQSDITRSRIHQLLEDPQATSAFTMNHLKIVLEAFDRLRRDLFEAINSDPEHGAALVTIISGDGGTSLDHPIIDLHGSQVRAKKTLKALGPNVFGMTELAFFNSHTHALGGRHLQRHEHAIIWGPRVAQASAIVKRHMSRFSANLTNAEVIDVRPLIDTGEVNIARMAAYLLKAPAKAMTWCPPSRGRKGHMHHSTKNDRKINYFKLAIVRSMLEFEDCAFATHSGLGIRRALATLTRAMMGSGVRLPAPFHPDAIPTFWVNTMQELRLKGWSLPIIMRRS